MQFIRRTNQKGATLLELIFALLILVTSLTAIIVLIVNSINASRESRNKLIATSLARESVEIARSIRDGNWVAAGAGVCDGAGLNEGLYCTANSDCGTGTCVIDDWYTGLLSSGDSTAIPVINDLATESNRFDFSVNSLDDTITRIKQQDDFYRQGSGVTGSNTEFYRIVYLNRICQDASGNENIAAPSNTDNCGSGDHSSHPILVGIRIISEVHWSSPDGRSVTIEERLYNWQTL